MSSFHWSQCHYICYHYISVHIWGNSLILEQVWRLLGYWFALVWTTRKALDSKYTRKMFWQVRSFHRIRQRDIGLLDTSLTASYTSAPEGFLREEASTAVHIWDRVFRMCCKSHTSRIQLACQCTTGQHSPPAADWQGGPFGVIAKFNTISDLSSNVYQVRRNIDWHNCRLPTYRQSIFQALSIGAANDF